MGKDLRESVEKLIQIPGRKIWGVPLHVVCAMH